MDQWLEEIRAALPELVVYQQEPMKKHTTFRVGGPADLYVCPKKQELPVILGLAKKKGLAVTVIGNGSNLLVGDKGIRGLVIEVGAQMNAVEVQGNILRAQAGALLSQVRCFRKLPILRHRMVWAAWNLLPEFREAWAGQ